MNYDRENFQSDYLCSACGDLLYIEPGKPSIDFCLGPTCTNFPNDVEEFIDSTKSGSPRVYEELDVLEETIIERVENWDHESLIRRTHEVRKALARSLIQQGMLPNVELWFACGEILLLANRSKPSGSYDDFQAYRTLINDVTKRGRDLRYLEDLRTKRYVLAREADKIRVFGLKYLLVSGIQNAHGILSGTDRSVYSRPIFPYEDIEATTVGHVDPFSTDDHSEWMDSFWPISLQLRHLFNSHHRTARQYKYDPDVIDLTIIFGWWLQALATDENSIIASEKEENELDTLREHISKHGAGYRSADEFVATYVDSHDLVPIVARAPSGWIMDRFTLFVFVIYLQGCGEPEAPTAITRNEPLLVKMRTLAGEKFEDWLRKQLHESGYQGPDHAVQISLDGREFEYDIMAVSEEKLSIVIADAKYRDMSPSSTTGTNLINQEFLGRGGLKDESERQESRHEFFLENRRLFSQFLNSERNIDEYEVVSYIITKQLPLAHRYKNTRILSALEFIESGI